MLTSKPLSAEGFARRRRALGMTQTELGRALGTTLRQVQRYESADYKTGDPERVPLYMRLALATLALRARADSARRRRRK